MRSRILTPSNTPAIGLLPRRSDAGVIQYGITRAHDLPRLAALLTLLALAGLLVVVLWLTTPWRPLGPVPGGRSPAAWQGDFTPAERAHEQAYHRAVRPPVYLGMVATLLTAGVLGLTPLGARLVSGAGRLLGGGWGAEAVLGGLAVALAGRLVASPFDVLVERVLRRYGLSTQTWGSWALDQLRGLALGAGLLAVVLPAAYLLARRLPRSWWLWGAIGAAVLTVVLSFLYPVVVEPVFNRFTPLPAGPLRTELIELARRDDVPVRDVLVADASRRTTTENAYVSGFGRTRRLVLYDTLLRASPEEVRLVVAHELGHAKRRDVLHATLIGALGGAAGVCGLFLLLGWSRLLRWSGAAGAGDPRSVALVLFLVALTGQLGQPVYDLVSRRIEARADVHSLELTRDPATFALVERRLALSNLSDLDPSPLVYALFATHPSTTERIALARDWARGHGLPPPGPLVDAGGASP